MKNIFLILSLFKVFMSCEKSKKSPSIYDCVTPPLVQSGIFYRLEPNR